MSKKRLYIELEFEFLCYGISCHHKDYRLAWNLNETLGIKLEKQEHIVLNDPLVQEQIFFPKFKFTDEQNQIEYLLLGNRNKWGFLLPEESYMDYFLLITSERFNTELIAEKIKSIDIVLSFGALDIGMLKNKERLLM